ncbi:GIY-YIG nuclease family protein [Sphingomonas koreensis]|nr:GIY-YIG nuclease family protein [Sphingomonas koreensis]
MLANRKNGALYIGVTSDIASRMVQHKAGEGSKFCREYGIDQLVYVEADNIEDAIAREKAMKKWRRAWKIALIERDNPDWRDLFFDLNR